MLVVAPITPQSHFRMSNDKKLHFLWAQKCKTLKKNKKKTVCLFQMPEMPPRVIWGIQTRTAFPEGKNVLKN